MKFILLIATWFTSLSVLAALPHGHFEEEVYIENPVHLKILRERTELIIDHVSPMGFEVFGPRGTKKYLRMLGIKFIEGHKCSHKIANAYPSFAQHERTLKDLAKKYPKIAKLSSIGKSVEGRELYFMKISDNVSIDEREPEFKYISSMHGDEITGRELSMQFIEDLLKQYGKDSRITELINNTEIYIMPSMNPDGSHKRQRANANGYDLNRNFPDWIQGDPNNSKNRQPETIALMNFQSSRHFSLSANFHGGAVVVNYPWDNTYDRHPFDNLIKNLSIHYAELNPQMKNSSSFSQGVTNGADWYRLNGGMQDWSYFWYGDLQVTVELSDSKWPSYSKINTFYQNNKNSMLKYLSSVHQGGGFHFSDLHQSGEVKIFEIKYDGSKINRGTYTFTRSEFFKILPIGEYEFQIYLKNKKAPIIERLTIDEHINPNGNYIQL